MKHKPPSYDRVRELLDYDPATGIMIWKVRRGKMLPGHKAGCLKPSGYYTINIDGVRYYLHRIIFLWYFQYYPEHEVDHKNGNPSDNTINNLQECKHICNIQKIGLRATNVTGVVGVSLSKSGKYGAFICCGGVRRYLGEYQQLLEAAKARYQEELLCEWPGIDSPGGAKEYLSKAGVLV